MATESGWYMAPVREEGKSQGLVGCLVCSWTRSSTASCGMEICRTEFSVFGLATMRLLSASFVACLLTEMVRCNSQSQFKSREETFQRDFVLRLILKICQLQQLLLSSPVQHLLEGLLGFFDLLSDFPALRLLAEPLMQGHHVVPHRISLPITTRQVPRCARLLACMKPAGSISDSQYPNLQRIARVKLESYQFIKNFPSDNFAQLFSLI